MTEDGRDELEEARAIPAVELDAERLIRQDARLRMGLDLFGELVRLALELELDLDELRAAARPVLAEALTGEPELLFVDAKVSTILALAVEMARAELEGEG